MKCNFIRRIAIVLSLVAIGPISSAFAQNTIDIPAGDDGVVINNPLLGLILSTAPGSSAINTAADTTINNEGSIVGEFNGVNFVNGLGSGVLNNARTGLIASASRAVNIGGPVALTNEGNILGLGDQRNGTVYSDELATDFSIVNSGRIDAGEGNQGSGVALEIGPLTTATVTNSGVIQGRTNTPGVSSASGLSGDGFRLSNFNGAADRVFQGTITNESTGRISSESETGTTAGFRAANTIGFQGTLNNDGLIEGVQNGVYFGNPVNGLGGDHTGGVVNNTGRIESGSRAFNVDGIGLTVNNEGSITGTGDQRNGTFYSDDTAVDFTLNNSGSIDAGLGNQGSGVSVSLSNDATRSDGTVITNSGVIQGRSIDGAPLAPTSPLAADGFRLEGLRGVSPTGSVTFAPAEFAGTIVNSGVIDSGDNVGGSTAGFHAVNGVSFTGTLDNTATGVISGAANGLYLGNPVGDGGADHTGGIINNDGLISSDSRAVNIDGIGITINNAGSILATGTQRNGTVYADSTAQDFTLNNSGVVDAGAGLEGAAFSVELAATGNDFTINNSGELLGRGNAGAGATQAGDGIRLERARNAGVLDGTSSGLFTGTINNTGTISSEGANGTVAGFRAVNGVSFKGQLNNGVDGVISGVQNGVYFGNPVSPAGGGDHTGGVVNNAGLISSDSRAFNIDGTGLLINNSGTILATSTQRNGTVYADSTAQDFTLNNSGVVDAGEGLEGAAFSVELAKTGNDFTIINSGELLGRGNAGAGATTAGDGIRLERTRVGGVLEGSTTGLFTGTITNTGTISSEGANGTVGGFRAVNGVSFQGTLENLGTISGVQNGVYFGNPVGAGGSDHTGGVVNNLGTISSDSRAFNLDGIGLEVNNLGDIVATGRQRNGTFYVDATGTDFVLNNTGSIDAAGAPGGAGSGVSIQVGHEQTGSIVNSGLIRGAGDNVLDAGVRLFSTGNFTGDIVNQSNGVIIGGENSAAILVEEGVNFNGAVQNAGVIDGAISLATGDLQLLDTSLLSLEIDSLDEFESVFVGGETLLDGTLELVFGAGFVAEAGDSIDLFDFGADTFASSSLGAFSDPDVAGNFDAVLANVDGLILDDLAIGGTITFGQAVAVVAVPEPSAIAFLAMGLAGVAVRRRRK